MMDSFLTKAKTLHNVGFLHYNLPHCRSTERLCSSPGESENMEWICQKNGLRLQSDTPHCGHKEGYCKYRTSCLIWFHERERKKKADQVMGTMSNNKENGKTE